MGLDEHAGDADRDRRPRQHRTNSRWPPTRRPARPAAAPNGWRRRSPARRSRGPGSAAPACRRPACCSRSWRRARSPARPCRLPPAILATTCCMSHGARNWPFLMLTARPVCSRGDQQVGLAAEEGGDLQHVDRLAPRSRTGRARGRRSGSAGQAGRGSRRRSAAPPARPMPRLPAPEVRFALSNEVLNTRPIPSRAAISFSAAATSSAWARLSSWQGPAIKARGRSAPNRACVAPAPTATMGLSGISTGPSKSRRSHARFAATSQAGHIALLWSPWS